MDLIYDPALVLYLPLYESAGDALASRDKHGHLCTVNGALWTPRGRSFDGSDDKLNLGTPAALNFGSGSFTVIVWCFFNSAAADKACFGAKDAANRRRISLRSNAFSRHNNGGTLAEIYPNGGPALPANRWHHLAGIYDSAAGKLRSYLNINTIKEGNASGTLDAATANYSGADPGEGGSDRWWLPGLLGEIWLFNRALGFLEVQRHYLATKFRYQ